MSLPRSDDRSVPGGREGAQAHAASLFLLSRKSKRGEGALTALLEKCEVAKAGAEVHDGGEGGRRKLERLCKGVVKIEWGKVESDGGGEGQEKKDEGDGGGGTQLPSKKQQSSAQKSPQKRGKTEDSYRVFSHPPDSGTPAFKIFVGRNKKQNDALSFKLAKSGDVWMHARGCPGAHVLVRSMNSASAFVEGGEDQNIRWHPALQAAADLASFYSDLRNEEKTPVTLALPKHLRKPPSAPAGAVTVREELWTILGRPLDVPKECVEKREEGAGKKGVRRKKG